MKTYSFFGKRLSIYSVIGFIAVITSSCGSYQNSSYYDSDGVYGNSQNNNKEVTNKNNSQSNKYQEYFSELNRDSQAFIDIENYTSVNNDTIKKAENYNPNNSSWGNNPQSVTVNVYDNNWGIGYWNNYWGWNNWYGPGWGWGWNSWYGPGFYLGWNVGWGWNNWGWNNWGWNSWYGNNWCGNFYNNYYYSGGRRNSSYPNLSNGNRYGVRNGTRASNYYSNRRNNTVTPGTRDYNTRSSSNPFRSNNYNPTRSNNSSQPTRNNNSSQPTRSNNIESSPVRSYTPSSSGTRSSSYGGGSYGGGSYGGGRSSSGGGRR